MDNIKLVYDREGVTLYQADCIEALQSFNARLSFKVQAVVTSPPYAEQRSGQYESILEEEYPAFTNKYLNYIKPIIAENGSVFINIRPSIKNGKISDYCLKTRLAVREEWVECEELIWIKPDSPPLGSTKRPRRSWESIYWFSLSPNPYVNLFANGNETNRLGFQSTKFTSGEHDFIHSGQSEVLKSGRSRVKDYIEVGVSANEKGLSHPASQPVEIPEWLISLSTQENEVVLDPFCGSGTTGVACINLNRKFIGIELNDSYCIEAIKRFEKAFALKQLPKKTIPKNKNLKSETVINGTLISF